MSLAYLDPELEKGYKRYHAKQCGRNDRTFCAIGAVIWTLTFIRIPMAASWHHRVLVVAALGSTMAPWLVGERRWTRHRELLVFVLRFLRTTALQAQFNPATGTAAAPQPTWLNALLVSRAAQLLMFSIFFRLRFPCHLLLQTLSLAIAWRLNRRTCTDWQSALGTAAEFDEYSDSLFTSFVSSCKRYTGTVLQPAHGCPLLLGVLQLAVGFVVPTFLVLHLELRSRRQYAAFCGVEPGAGDTRGTAAAAEHSSSGNWQHAVLGIGAAAVCISACLQLLEAFDRWL